MESPLVLRNSHSDADTTPLGMLVKLWESFLSSQQKLGISDWHLVGQDPEG